MKKLFLFFLMFCFVNQSFAQKELKVTKLKNNKLIKVLNNSELISQNRNEYIAVKIYKFDNGTASAGFSNSEVSHNLLIAISEFDENPNQNLFEIGSFYNPKFIKWLSIKEDQKTFKIEYGTNKNRKHVIIKVNINELKVEG